MPVASPALAEQLNAAVRDRRWIHHIDCATYGEDGERRDCDCGIPDLLGDLLVLLGPAARLLETRTPQRRAS